MAKQRQAGTEREKPRTRRRTREPSTACSNNRYETHWTETRHCYNCLQNGQFARGRPKPTEAKDAGRQGSACASEKLSNREQQESPAPANSQQISGWATGATGEAKNPDVAASLTHRPSQSEQSNPAVGGRVVAKASTVVCVGDRQSQVGRRRSHCRFCRTELSAVSASIRNRNKTRTRLALMPERMSQPQKRNVLQENGSEELRLHTK